MGYTSNRKRNNCSRKHVFNLKARANIAFYMTLNISAGVPFAACSVSTIGSSFVQTHVALSNLYYATGANARQDIVYIGYTMSTQGQQNAIICVLFSKYLSVNYHIFGQQHVTCT